MLLRLGLPRVETANDGDMVRHQVASPPAREHGGAHTLPVSTLQALARINEAERQGDPFVMLFLDIITRRLNGDDVLMQLRRRGSQVPAIACTGNAMPSDIEHYEAVGFAAAVTKPFSVHELGRTIWVKASEGLYLLRPTAMGGRQLQGIAFCL